MKRVERLALEFDRAFAEPAKVDRARGIGALAIRAGDQSYIVRLADITTVGRVPKIVPLPNGSALQLGIAGIRGTLVTVYSLAALLGGSAQKVDWIAVVYGVALGFDALEGQLTLEPGAQPPNLLDIKALLERGGIAE